MGSFDPWRVTHDQVNLKWHAKVLRHPLVELHLLSLLSLDVLRLVVQVAKVEFNTGLSLTQPENLTVHLRGFQRSWLIINREDLPAEVSVLTHHNWQDTSATAQVNKIAHL